MSDKNISIEISSRDYWFKVVGFLQQNWALIDLSSNGTCTVFFIGDSSGVFDRLSFSSDTEAKKALKQNGFTCFADDKKAQNFISIPKPPFKEWQHPNGLIYSSGKFWQSCG